jgi:hypothetical protein
MKSQAAGLAGARPGPAAGPDAGALRDDGRVGISVDELVSYTERAVDQMAGIVAGLGDDLANRRPALPGANSPYVILRHCLGVMEFWGGQVVAGREIQRDRAAEFRASGPVAELVAATKAAREAFRADAATADPTAAPRKQAGDDPDELESRSQGSALLHVLEEVTQHLGQMELTRDVLREGRPA